LLLGKIRAATQSQENCQDQQGEQSATQQPA
jgi:hypothetical protein